MGAAEKGVDLKWKRRNAVRSEGRIPGLLSSGGVLHPGQLSSPERRAGSFVVLV